MATKVPFRIAVLVPRSAFSTSTRVQGPNFFDLGARAMSRENYHISKHSGVPHIESSPCLQLLRAERDLAEKRKDDQGKATRGTTEAAPNTWNDPYSVFIDKGPTPPVPTTAPVGERAAGKDQLIAELQRHLESSRRTINGLREALTEYERQSDSNARRESIWKYLFPVGLAAGIFGALKGYEWQVKYQELDKEMDETRREIGAVKRERDHIRKAWYEKLKNEGRKAPEQIDRREQSKKSESWRLSNLLWK